MSTNETLEKLRGLIAEPVFGFKLAGLALKHRGDPVVAQYMLDHVGEGWELWAEVMNSKSIQNTMEEVKSESELPRHVRVKALFGHFKGENPDPSISNIEHYGSYDGRELELLGSRREAGGEITISCGLVPNPDNFPPIPGFDELVAKAALRLEERRKTESVEPWSHEFRDRLAEVVGIYRRAVNMNLDHKTKTEDS